MDLAQEGAAPEATQLPVTAMHQKQLERIAERYLRNKRGYIVNTLEVKLPADDEFPAYVGANIAISHRQKLVLSLTWWDEGSASVSIGKQDASYGDLAEAFFEYFRSHNIRINET